MKLRAAGFATALLLSAGSLTSCDTSESSGSVLRATFSLVGQNLTVDQWLLRFPGDSLVPEDFACAIVKGRGTSATEGRWSRTVVFAPPPAQDRIPDDTSFQALQRACVVVSITTSATLQTDSAAAAIERDMRTANAGIQKASDSAGTATWRVAGAIWSLSRAAEERTTVIAQATPESSGGARATGLDPAGADADTALWREAMSFFASATDAPRPGGNATEVAAIAATWLEGKRSATAEVRSSAFLVADLALATATWPRGRGASHEILRPLAAFGATATDFEGCEPVDPDCDTQRYSRSLADSALVIGRGLLIGSVAFTTLAGQERDAPALRSLVAHGELHLVSAPRDRRLAALQIALGDAYADLAATENGAPDARALALKWYAAAVQSTTDPVVRTAAWNYWYTLALRPTASCRRFLNCI